MRKVVLTVGELLAALQELPPDQPVYQRGNMGDWIHGITIQSKNLAKHRNPDENYVADLTDPVWSRGSLKRDKSTIWLPEFAALILGR
jgi:hypothetical protein